MESRKITIIKPEQVAIQSSRFSNTRNNEAAYETGFVLPGVSVITCTNRPEYIDKVFANYLRQNQVDKELIVVLNNDTMNLEEWRTRAVHHQNIRVFQLAEYKSLGECLNFAVDQTRFHYIAKFDDDDYYAAAYLEDAMIAFQTTEAGIVGKHASYIYFEGSRTLALQFPHQENCYVDFVFGPTMVIKKEVFDQVRFRPLSIGEDTRFLKDCTGRGIRIYALDRYNFVYIRRQKSHTPHTWEVEERAYLEFCQVIARTDDYITPATRQKEAKEPSDCVKSSSTTYHILKSRYY